MKKNKNIKKPEVLQLPAFFSATRIRTLKMTESESAALPFGYSATWLLFDSKRIIYEFPEKIKHFFQKVTEVLFLTGCGRFYIGFRAEDRVLKKASGCAKIKGQGRPGGLRIPEQEEIWRRNRMRSRKRIRRRV